MSNGEENWPQPNQRYGMTRQLSDGIRSMMRQDPDIILVGEIRDQETAEIAIRAALTGHLVFSTLHTNDAPSAVTRLTDMGVEPFLLSSSLLGVLAQRLVRVLCPHCKQLDHSPSAEALRSQLKLDPEARVCRAVGCRECRQTGYHGRRGIFEWMKSTPEVRRLILKNASSGEIRDAARRGGLAGCGGGVDE